MTMNWKRWALVGTLLFVCDHFVSAQLPDHPVLTEAYTDPNGLDDGPFCRDPANLHQEYIELYLPPAASLSPSLNKDALRLTFYEVEGDSTSGGLGLINYRFDLPTFDLDPDNGTTADAIARPSSGVVVLGWVNYTTTTPVVLAGDPSTRLAMINGGITTTGGTYIFIAINGAQGTGTTNFPVPTAENKIDMPGEACSGVIQNGSGVYLLVNRDSPSYVMLCDDAHTAECPAGADPDLPDDGQGLNTPAHLDGFAPQDDVAAGDLTTILTPGGAFTPLIPQLLEVDSSATVPGTANGYARRYVDVRKTTEDGAVMDDPLVDAAAYRHVRNNGPFFATPGRAVLSTTAPELGLAVSAEHAVQVLAQTTANATVLSANVGGNFPINITTSPGASSNPSAATFAAGSPATGIPGQTLAFPTVAVTAPASAAHGAVASATTTVTATNTNGGDPAVVAPVQMTTVTATVLKPTTGLNASGQPFQTTVFAAIQGIPSNPALANEFRPTSLGTYVANNLGGAVLDSKGHGSFLIDPSFDIGLGHAVPPATSPGMQDMHSDGLNYPDPGCFINSPGPPGKLDLVQTVEQSAEVQSGATTYIDSIGVGGECTMQSPFPGIRARRVNIPDSLAFGGSFTPTEALHFVEAGGRAGTARSGLSNAATTRTFELAILDTNVRDDNTLETGANDDFGIIIEVATTEPGAPVVTGEFVFLSFTGGLQGADIDGMAVPPGNNIANIVFLDLDHLHAVLGIRTVEAIFLVDAGASGNLDTVEVFSLNPDALAGCQPPDCSDGNPCTTDSCVSKFCQHINNTASCDDGLFCTTTDVCSGGTCTGGGTPCAAGELCNEDLDTCAECFVSGDCNDNKICTDDACVNNNCQFTNNVVLCNDNNPCTNNDQCSNGSCLGTPIPNCNCTSDSQCNDNDGCTVDSCFNPGPNGTCLHTPLSCQDADPCTIDGCSNGVCTHTPVPCDPGDVCYQGQCYVPCSTAVDCNDGVSCTVDTCDTSPPPPIDGICFNTPSDALCDTGLFCNAQRCDPMVGCIPDGYVPPDDPDCRSNDGNPCADPGRCDEATDTCGGCNVPTVVAGGSRYLLVTPADQGSTSVALRVIGECGDTQSECVDRYVQSKCNGGMNDGINCQVDANCPKRCEGGTNRSCVGGTNPGVLCCPNPSCNPPAVPCTGGGVCLGNPCTLPADCPLGVCAGFCDAGTLGSTPFYKLPSQWAATKVRGAQIRPGANYHIETECKFDPPVGTVRSDSVLGATWPWGEVDGNDIVNVLDINAVVACAKSQFVIASFEQCNVWACTPDKGIDVLDIAVTVDALKGVVFARPCPTLVCP